MVLNLRFMIIPLQRLAGPVCIEDPTPVQPAKAGRYIQNDGLATNRPVPASRRGVISITRCWLEKNVEQTRRFGATAAGKTVNFRDSTTLLRLGAAIADIYSKRYALLRVNLCPHNAPPFSVPAP